MKTPGGFTTGFDYLRIILSVSVLVFHSIALSSGSDTFVWAGPFRFLPASILPMFFALSGFLVTGSLKRVQLHQFVMLRILRLIPALAVEVALSALLIGPIVTTIPLSAYYTDHLVWKYFLNIIGSIHYFLPGVFADNPAPGVMNGQLWTIPFELESYLSLTILSILTVVRRRFWFAMAVIGTCLVATTFVNVNHTGQAFDNNLPGRMLVLSFLAAVVVYLYRDKLPFSNMAGVVSMVISMAMLEYPQLCYLAPLPIAYATVWLGLMRPPSIPFGDLSYGVYLFHFPVEQTLVHYFPSIQTWWQLTAVALPITALFAWLSWTVIEHPVLQRKKQALALSDRLMNTAGLRTKFG